MKIRGTTYEEIVREIAASARRPFWERWRGRSFGIWRVSVAGGGYYWGLFIPGRKPWYFCRSWHTPYMDEIFPNAACYRRKQRT